MDSESIRQQRAKILIRLVKSDQNLCCLHVHQGSFTQDSLKRYSLLLSRHILLTDSLSILLKQVGVFNIRVNQSDDLLDLAKEPKDLMIFHMIKYGSRQSLIFHRSIYLKRQFT